MTAPPDYSLKPALDYLCDQDRDIAHAFETCGLPPVRGAEPGFAGLINMIIGQQVSTHAAKAIVTRLSEALPQMDATGFLALAEEDLRGIGFSRAKVRYGRALAAAIVEGDLAIDELEAMDDQAVMAALMAVPGIGRWTAEIYLLFAMKRPDVWPAGDLAIVVAMQRIKSLPERPSEKEMRLIAEPWRPHRSAAARFLWHAYRHQGVVLQSSDGT